MITEEETIEEQATRICRSMRSVCVAAGKIDHYEGAEQYWLDYDGDFLRCVLCDGIVGEVGLTYSDHSNNMIEHFKKHEHLFEFV